MSIDDCQKLSRDSKVKVEERGAKAVFLNEARATFKVTRIDGCVQSNELAADYCVSSGTSDVLVELKGKNVCHAAAQIIATARFLKKENLSIAPKAALIVCRQYPRIDTTVQRARVQFMQLCKGPLHVVARNAEYNFDRVLAFDGPF